MNTLFFANTHFFLSNTFLRIGFIFGVLFLNTIMVACHFALVKLRYLAINPDTEGKLRKQKTLHFIMERAESIGQILHVGSMLSTFILGLLLFPFLEQYILSFSFPLGYVEKLFFLGLFGSFIFILQSIFTYWIPQALGMLFPMHTLSSNSWGILILNALLYPFVQICRSFSESFLKIVGTQPKEAFNILDLHVQIRALGDNTNAIPLFTQEILENALKMKDLQASDVLLPRSQVQYMDLNDSLAMNIQKAKREGYTRYPISDGDLDNCIGIIHIKDLFCTEEPIEKIDLHGIKRPIMRVPLDTPLQKIFRRLLHKRMHMALVVDEFQRTVGIITLEHIIEELVGDIQDEFDKEQDSIQRISKNTYKIAGLTPIHEVEEVLNIELEHQNVSTFGGLITYELGRIPEKGEKCSFQDIQVTIEEASKRRIISTIVHKKN